MEEEECALEVGALRALIAFQQKTAEEERVRLTLAWCRERDLLVASRWMWRIAAVALAVMALTAR